MPKGKIPFGSAVIKNTSEQFVSEANVSFYDGYLSEAGCSIKRPGLAGISVLSGGTYGRCNGLFWWPTQQKMVVVASSRVYVITKTGPSSYSSVDVTNAIPGTGRITFAYDASYFYLADGGRIMYSAGVAGDLADIADADAPTACTHVSYLDGYIIGNNGNRRFYYSAVEDGLTWSALDFASASGNPDNVIGQVVYNRQIFLIGESTTEIWYNDGETPFSRGDGGFIETGCIAASSILKTKLGVLWLDTDRNFVLSNGGQPKAISLDYKTVIDSFTTVSDCETHFLEWRGLQFMIANFLSEKRTIVYNFTTDSWSDWGYYVASSAEYEGWRGRSVCWAPSWNLWVVGDRGANAISYLSDSTYSDGAYPIRFLKRTGFVNHGSDTIKRCNRVTLKLKRGSGSISSSTSPKLMLRWKEDGANDWSNIEEIDLGQAGDAVHHVDVYPRGAYRSRQYELSCTDDVPVAFLDAEEDYTVLR